TRLEASCSRRSSSVSSCVGASAVIGRSSGADGGDALFTSEETLFLVVALRAWGEWHIAQTEECVVVADQVTLGQGDLIGVLEDRGGDLVSEVLAHLGCGGNDRGRNRKRRHAFFEEVIGVGIDGVRLVQRVISDLL